MKPSKYSNSPSLGLIGCGYWGKNLARNFKELGVLHTICETDPYRYEWIRDQFGNIAVNNSVETLLENSAIKQIAIAAPAVLHHQLAKKALLAGKDVFVEKPLCLSSNEALEVLSIAEKNSRILMVGHLLQFHPAICRLQELIQDGVFGQLYRVTSNRLNLGKVRQEENALWSLAPHDISVILSLLSDHKPESVQCMARSHLQDGIFDWATTAINFSCNVTAQIQCSWLHPFKEQKLCVIGEKVMAVFDDTQDWPEKLILRKSDFNNSEIERVPLMEEEPLRVECEHFLDSCISREPAKTDAREGIRVLEILEAAQSSADSGGTAVVPNHWQFAMNRKGVES